MSGFTYHYIIITDIDTSTNERVETSPGLFWSRSLADRYVRKINADDTRRTARVITSDKARGLFDLFALEESARD